MGEIEGKAKLKIFGLGFLFSLLGTLMLYAFFARIINDLALNLLEGNDILMIIVLGTFGITFVVSVIVGIFESEGISKRTVLMASGIAILPTFIILLAICYFGLAIIAPDSYSQLQGADIIFTFPSVMVHFSLYGLGSPFTLIPITIVMYYLFFIMFLETFYEEDLNYKKYESIFTQFERRRL